MGAFDYVYVRNRNDMVCNRGHALDEFQTRDLGEQLNTFLLDGDVLSNPYGELAGLRRGCGTVRISGYCDACGGGHLGWTWFTLVLTNWHVVQVKK